MGVDFDTSWALIVANLTAIVATAQTRMSRQAVEYIPDVLEDTGQVRAIAASAEAVPGALVGVTGTGVGIDTALYSSVIVAKIAVGNGKSATRALKEGGARLTQTAGTILSDTGRAGERLAMSFRPIGGYVRMLTPPSCSRCVLLAGKRYQMDVAFQRHPQCDCRHIPASESVAEDMTVNPDEYFESLTQEQQDSAFTKSGAEAIRNGADMGQVVSARRGMYTTADGYQFTREGVTKRGLYGGRARAGFYKEDGKRYSYSKRRRLMPEQIQKQARNKEHYLQMLKSYGYII